jgi:hypothetical protein
LALLAGGTLQPPPDSAAARSRRAAPVVQVRVAVDDARHRLQELQSLALHEEAVRLAKANPILVRQVRDTAERWLASGLPFIKLQHAARKLAAGKRATAFPSPLISEKPA